MKLESAKHFQFSKLLKEFQKTSESLLTVQNYPVLSFKINIDLVLQAARSGSATECSSETPFSPIPSQYPRAQY